ncbi:oxidoreductase [Mucilaginibacter sp. P25]|uniref:NADP-dependent 3-hydroxy acid dehydrogenase YdfG n=1 Tax=Mucilaginibacter gossypii TaxID=551996 RepID=A0A1G8NH33_9SPHI|nr:oxidoreductase [Mucilaginibacter gossypii]SDI79569.1 NADP-dependent 3-hydroxy acid dehydrogenase YdfG [Mucilaginibacter gossypii]
MKTQKVILVTGASKGFGLEIAKTALAAGDKVIATVRSKADQLATSLNDNPNLLVVTMDVTNEAQVKAAVAEGLLRFGKIDVVINNAGYGIVTAIEEATDAEVKAQYETNVFGLLNVVRAVLPHLRAQRSGHIINVSSLFGFDAIPGWALYGSTKFAVEGISKGLAVELAPLNIKVTVVEPGLFSTEFLSAESYSAAKNVIDDYAATVGPMRAGANQLHGNQPGDPRKLARVVVDIAHNENPPLHLPIGKDAVGMYKANAEKTSEEIDQWIEVSTGTDHDHVAAN